MARTRTRNRRGQFVSGGRRRSGAMVRYSKPTVIRVNAGGGRKVRRYRRRSGGRIGGMKTDLKSLGFDFAYSAGYGYLREGGTDNFNELMDKVPGGSSLGKDLRNSLVFWAADRFLIKSSILRGLARAAVARAGYKFGQSKFTTLQGDDDGMSLRGSMG